MPPCDFSDPALDAFNEPKNLAFFFCRYIKGAQCGGEMSADARPVFLVDAQSRDIGGYLHHIGVYLFIVDPLIRCTCFRTSCACFVGGAHRHFKAVYVEGRVAHTRSEN